MMNKRVYRFSESVLLLVTLFVLAASFYFEYVKGLQPCPLCLVQRFCTILFAMFCLMGLCLSTPKPAKLVTVLQLFFTAAGLFFATRQMWLQSFPPSQAPSCLPNMEILIRYFPWQDIVHAFFWGAGDCAEVVWTWLGLSMPAWAALYFLAMFSTSAVIFFAL